MNFKDLPNFNRNKSYKGNLKNLKRVKLPPMTHHEHKSRNKAAMLKSRYNMTLDNWDAIFIQQNGKCAICQISASEFKKELVVDHCHKTGKIRGLLCDSCNVGIGRFNDNITNLKRAMKYLTRN